VLDRQYIGKLKYKIILKNIKVFPNQAKIIKKDQLFKRKNVFLKETITFMIFTFYPKKNIQFVCLIKIKMQGSLISNRCSFFLLGELGYKLYSF
jgi:hypothetical protein